MGRAPRSTRQRLAGAAARAIILGAICTGAVSIAAALAAPAAVPAGMTTVAAWRAPVPPGWPATPWSSARRDAGWGRDTWELRADPIGSTAERAKGFPVQWVLHCGWPLPAFECVRHRIRALWDQGENRQEPQEGPSASLAEGVAIPAAALGASEGHFLIPIVPVWSGILVDTLAWGAPFFVLSAALIMVRTRDAKSTPPPAP